MQNSIRARAKESGYSLERLAKKIGVNKWTVYSWSSGRNFPRKNHLIKLCKLLKCTLDELYNLNDKKCLSKNSMVAVIKYGEVY